MAFGLKLLFVINFNTNYMSWFKVDRNFKNIIFKFHKIFYLSCPILVLKKKKIMKYCNG